TYLQYNNIVYLIDALQIKHTNWNTDYKKRWYCKKHGNNVPKNPDRSKRKYRFFAEEKERLPRKRKKLYKEVFRIDVEKITGNRVKPVLTKGFNKITGGGYQLMVFQALYLKYLKKAAAHRK